MCTTSGPSFKSSPRLSKYRSTLNRSASCRAMSSSRSQTPTMSHPSSRRICSAWASAIFPHPTIATLSGIMRSSLATLEVPPQTFGRRYLRRPAQPSLHLFVGIAAPFPVRMPRSPVEDERQLSLGPRGVLLPRATEDIAREARDGDGPEGADVSLIKAQEVPARGEIVVDDVQHLSVDAVPDARQDDRVGAVVHVGEGDDVRAAEVQENPECPGADASRYPSLAGSVRDAGSNEDVGNCVLSPVLDDELILLDLRKAIGLASELGVLLDRTGFVEATT